MAYRDREKRLAASRAWRQKNKERMRELWARGNAKRAPKRKKRKAHRRVDDMDLFPHRCLWHFWADDGGCRKAAKWRCGQWRVCDKHYRKNTGLVLIESNQRTGDEE